MQETALLASQAEEASELFLTIWEDRAKAIEEARTLKVEIDRNAMALRSTVLPELPDMSRAPGNLDQAETTDAALKRRSEIAEARRAALIARRDALSRYIETVGRIVHDTETGEQALAKLMPLIAGMQDRVAQGELNGEVLDRISATVPPGVTPQYIADELVAWGREAARAALESEMVEGRLQELEAAVSDDAAHVARSARWLGEARMRAALEDRLATEQVGELIASFRTRIGAFDDRFVSLDGDLQAMRQLLRRGDSLEETMQGLRPPDLEVGDGSAADGVAASLYKAERRVALAASIASYREERLETLRALFDISEEAVAVMERTGAAVAPALEEALFLNVLAGLLEERAGASETSFVTAGDDALPARLEELRNAREEIAESNVRFAALRETIRETLGEARRERAEAQNALRESEALLEREQRWSVFLDELRGRPVDDVVAVFEEANAQFDDQAPELAAIDRRISTLEAEIAAGEQSLRESVDPVALAVREDREAFREWLASRQFTLPPIEEPEQEADDVAATDATEPAPAEQVSEVESWSAGLHRLRDDVIVRRAGFYEENQERRAALRSILSAGLSDLQASKERVDEVFDAARRAWAAADIIAQGVRNGDLQAGAAPEAIASWSTREQLLIASETDARIGQIIARIEERLSELDSADAVEVLRDPLQTWREELDTEIELLSDISRLAAQFDAIADLETLDPIERQRMETQIAERIQQDLGVYATLDDFFGSSEIESMDELMRRYYERLVISERRIENIERRQSLLATTIEHVQEVRPALETLGEGLAGIADQARKQLDISASLTRAALQPNAAGDILSGLSERHENRTFTTEDIAALPVNLEGDALAEARRERIELLNGPWARASGYDLWAASISRRVEPLGGIDAKAEAYQGFSARLEATKADIQRTIDRLNGMSPEEINALTFDQGGGAQRLALGEIGALQEQRRDRVNTNAAISFASLIIIPVIALAAILLARFFGGRAVARVERRRSAEGGAVERAMTLNGIFQSVWTILVLALAGVYMLQAVNVDVTPILASLGIFGLAIAFGAQATMRDIFAGIFILLDKRLNVGDWGYINGVCGQVESVGLRTTTLRKWDDFTLNYFNNGDINVIENWNRYKHDASGMGASCHVRLPTSMNADPVKVLDILNTLIAEIQADDTKTVKLIKLAIQPGINKIHPDSHTYEFFVSMTGDAYVWGFAREFQTMAMKRLVEAGVPLPETKLEITNLPGRLTGDDIPALTAAMRKT